MGTGKSNGSGMVALPDQMTNRFGFADPGLRPFAGLVFSGFVTALLLPGSILGQ
jgi:hypothetical protein